MPTRRFTQHLTDDVHAVRAWHLRLGALTRLLPSWSGVRLLVDAPVMAVGARVVLSVPMGPVWSPWRRTWKAMISQVDDHGFVDTQSSGPFDHWLHGHRFTSPADDSRTCTAEDIVEWRLPLLVRMLGGNRLVEADLQRLFAWRQQRLARDLERLRPGRHLPPMTIAISGDNGLIARQVLAFLRTAGHRVLSLVRTSKRLPLVGVIGYDPGRGSGSHADGWIDQAALSDVDAVVHLAGASVSKRWSDSVKREILRSRVASTDLLAKALATLRQADPQQPRTMILASGISAWPVGPAADGGPHRDGILDLPAAMPAWGTSFLAGVVRAWEGAADPARAAGVRVVHLRLGAVLDPAGGALGSMLPLFRLGLGGPIGGGRQPMPWISSDDVVYQIHQALVDQRWHGVFNAVSPTPCTQGDVAHSLAQVMGRPGFLPTPSFPLRLLFGEMAEELVLTGPLVVPERALALGYRFADPDLHGALRFCLGRLQTQAQVAIVGPTATTAV